MPSISASKLAAGVCRGWEGGGQGTGEPGGEQNAKFFFQVPECLSKVPPLPAEPFRAVGVEEVLLLGFHSRKWL